MNSRDTADDTADAPDLVCLALIDLEPISFSDSHRDLLLDSLQARLWSLDEKIAKLRRQLMDSFDTAYDFIDALDSMTFLWAALKSIDEEIAKVRLAPVGDFLILPSEISLITPITWAMDKESLKGTEFASECVYDEEIYYNKKVDDVQMKLEMLTYWKQTRAHYTSANADLIGMMEGFIKRKTKKGIFGNRNFDFISRAVVGAIDDEDWMRFVRLKLGLCNDEIDEIRLKFGKYQTGRKLLPLCTGLDSEWFYDEEIHHNKEVNGVQLKLKMLKYWKQTRAHYTSANADLIEMMEGFLKRKTKKGIFGNCNFDFISRAVVSAIDDEDWMRFVRLKLELRNDEIDEIRLKFGKCQTGRKLPLNLNSLDALTGISINPQKAEDI